MASRSRCCRAGRASSTALWPRVGRRRWSWATGSWVLYNGKNETDGSGDPALGRGAYSGGQALFDAADPSKLIERGRRAVLRARTAVGEDGAVRGGHDVHRRLSAPRWPVVALLRLRRQLRRRRPHRTRRRGRDAAGRPERRGARCGRVGSGRTRRSAAPRARRGQGKRPAVRGDRLPDLEHDRAPGERDLRELRESRHRLSARLYGPFALRGRRGDAPTRVSLSVPGVAGPATETGGGPGGDG